VCGVCADAGGRVKAIPPELMYTTVYRLNQYDYSMYWIVSSIHAPLLFLFPLLVKRFTTDLQ